MPSFPEEYNKDKEFKKLKRLIKIFTKTSIKNSWKGGGHPKEIPTIEAQFEKAKKNLDDHIKHMKEIF